MKKYLLSTAFALFASIGFAKEYKQLILDARVGQGIEYAQLSEFPSTQIGLIKTKVQIESETNTFISELQERVKTIVTNDSKMSDKDKERCLDKNFYPINVILKAVSNDGWKIEQMQVVPMDKIFVFYIYLLSKD